MSNKLTVRLQLVEQLHDALLAFHKDYPARVVNTLLLRLAESCLAEDKLKHPSVENFLLPKNIPEGGSKFITLRFSQEDYPRTVAFYTGLPAGGRKGAFANVLNKFVALAEQDKKIMDNAYWGDPQTTISEQVGGMESAQVDPAAGLTPANAEAVEEVQPRNLAASVAGGLEPLVLEDMTPTPLASEPEPPQVPMPDPLEGLDTGL